MEMSGRIYALATFPMLSIELVSEWDPESVCMIGKEEKFLSLPGNEPRFLGRSGPQPSRLMFHDKKLLNFTCNWCSESVNSTPRELLTHLVSDNLPYLSEESGNCRVKRSSLI
jgi:hypothetical protein